jgi:tetratricopeptide (TPR) repeat protein
VTLRIVLAATAIALTVSAGADTIVLLDGSVLEADQAWYEGVVLRYRKDGQLLELPRESISRVEPSGPEGTLIDPDVLNSRERLSIGDPGEALRFARLALFRDPTSLLGLEALTAAQLALDQPQRAQESALAALRLNPERGRSLELLGDSLAALGDLDGARARYRSAYEIEADRRLRRKLEALEPPSNHVSSARFRIRYDGDSNEPLGLAVLGVLDRTWEEYEEWLGFSPGLPVTVVLQTASAFRDTTRAPQWAAAWNDGTIRVPVRGIERPTPDLIRVLCHELAHSFLTARTGDAVPTWLHEGLAQWLEGGDPARRDAGLAAAARAGKLHLLEELEGPFAELSEKDATYAYAESLSAVAYLLRLRGAAGMRQLIEELADGRSPGVALEASYGIGYTELQRDWEAHLRTADRTTEVAAAGR